MEAVERKKNTRAAYSGYIAGERLEFSCSVFFLLSCHHWNTHTPKHIAHLLMYFSKSVAKAMLPHSDKRLEYGLIKSLIQELIRRNIRSIHNIFCCFVFLSFNFFFCISLSLSFAFAAAIQLFCWLLRFQRIICVCVCEQANDLKRTSEWFVCCSNVQHFHIFRFAIYTIIIIIRVVLNLLLEKSSTLSSLCWRQRQRWQRICSCIWFEWNIQIT